MYFCGKSGFKMWFVALKNGWGCDEKQMRLARFSTSSKPNVNITFYIRIYGKSLKVLYLCREYGKL